MAASVATQRLLWLSLAQLSDRDKTPLLDAPVSVDGVFGDAVGMMTAKFEAEQKSRVAFQAWMPHGSKAEPRGSAGPTATGGMKRESGFRSPTPPAPGTQGVAEASFQTDCTAATSASAAGRSERQSGPPRGIKVNVLNRHDLRQALTVSVLGLVFGATAVATIITLSVLYALHEAPNRPWDQYRLPDTLKPRKYNVTMWPRLTKNEHSLYVFTGHSTVDFECVKDTDLILIHSSKLNLTKSSRHHATLTGLGGAVAPTIKTTWLQVTTEYLVIQLNSELEPGKSYQLYTSFTGELADDLEGFYRSEYYEGSELKVLATTQMEATDARKAFPCFDEPALKAIFYLTLIHNRNTVALSNSMEIGSVNTTMDGVEVSVTTFEPTPIMSTYLLAFVVCEYDSIRTPARAKVLLRVWARRQAIAEGQGDYALEKAASLLEYLERYYNVTNPLKKPGATLNSTDDVR
ncbi:aminopeptidase Ey-like [Alosa pseudoharengus]|uniref:aminopeptidase Ey-like n=1 Tax=Alosa pseudoharengus TaxID=34774 RepID=UPI003F885FC4